MISTQANTAGHRFERLRCRLKNRHLGPGRAFYSSTLGFDSPPLHLPKRRIRIATYDPRRAFWAGPMSPFFLLVLCGLGGVLSAFSKTLSSRFPCLVIAPVYTSPMARRVCSSDGPSSALTSRSFFIALSDFSCSTNDCFWPKAARHFRDFLLL